MLEKKAIILHFIYHEDAVIAFKLKQFKRKKKYLTLNESKIIFLCTK